MNEETKEIEIENILSTFSKPNKAEEIVEKAKEKLRNKQMLTKDLSVEDVIIYTQDNSESFMQNFKILEKNGLTFNIFAALLGPLYFMYRKMYLSALLFILANMIAAGNPFLEIMLMLTMGLCGYYIYYEKTKYDIKMVNLKYKDNQIRKEILKQRGGVNIILPALCIGISALVACFITFLFIVGLVLV